VVLFVCVTLHARLLPFRKAAHNHMETASLVANFVLFNLALVPGEPLVIECRSAGLPVVVYLVPALHIVRASPPWLSRHEPRLLYRLFIGWT
jgi:hypothetical protein